MLLGDRGLHPALENVAATDSDKRDESPVWFLGAALGPEKRGADLEAVPRVCQSR